jgi:hypothetical protein
MKDAVDNMHLYWYFLVLVLDSPPQEHFGCCDVSASQQMFKPLTQHRPAGSLAASGRWHSAL